MPSLWFSPLTPQGGCLSVQFPFSSESLPRFTGLDLIVFIPVLPNLVYIFLTTFFVQVSFCQFPVSFQ